MTTDKSLLSPNIRPSSESVVDNVIVNVSVSGSSTLSSTIVTATSREFQ